MNFTAKAATTCAIVSLVLALVACDRSETILPHKLVATAGEHSVPLYSDEHTYMKVSRMKQQGGVEGMAGDLGKDLSARQIDDETSVKVVSSDPNGAVVEITEGPMKGESGFVAMQNLD
jgi:hypothetical protein